MGPALHGEDQASEAELLDLVGDLRQVVGEGGAGRGRAAVGALRGEAVDAGEHRQDVVYQRVQLRACAGRLRRDSALSALKNSTASLSSVKELCTSKLSCEQSMYIAIQ